jgi:hypothetical protein
MKLDIHGETFDVSTAVLDGMLSAMTQTAKDGVEHGFNLCESGGVVDKGVECIGNACSIALKGCPPGKGHVAGSFHSHPDVISFSLADYLTTVNDASNHPEKKALMCVALKDAGVRCKAVTKIPPPNFTIPMIDCEQTRDMIKPFFTKKVSISKQQITELMSGTPWEKLSPEEQIIAIDEGDVVVPTSLFSNIGQIQGGTMAKKSLVEVAQQYINEPTGKYPWETKTVTKSVKTDAGVGLEMVNMPTLESDETQFVPTRDIEIPDASLLHMNEVASYIHAFSPIILTKKKDDGGKWKILDGRHRLAAWRASGYKQIPVVFSTDEDYK